MKVTFWKVDKGYFGQEDHYQYYVMPYDVKGTLHIHFGYDFKYREWCFHYIPSSLRYTSFFKFLANCRPTEKWAKKVMKKRNNKLSWKDEIREDLR